MRNYILSFLFTVLILSFLGCKAKSQYQPSEDITRKYELTIQPIIVRSDAGSEPASMVIPEKLVEKAYEKASIDFYFLHPIFLDNTNARDGVYNLDSISNIALQKGLIKYNDGKLYMFFVDAIDGRKGPMGMGMQNGNIIFIALGDKLPPGFNEDIKNMQAFVIAHEVGHNLGLVHAVDDPNVPNDIPNIQGDGAFKDRIDPKYSLNDYQIKIILKSPLIHIKTATK